jgi:hypothetical protein
MRITIVAVGGVPGEIMGMGLYVLPAVTTAIEVYRGGVGGGVVRVLREGENLDHSRGVIREVDDGAITTTKVETKDPGKARLRFDLGPGPGPIRVPKRDLDVADGIIIIIITTTMRKTERKHQTKKIARRKIQLLLLLLLLQLLLKIISRPR